MSAEAVVQAGVRPGQCFGLYTRQRCEQRMRKYQVGHHPASWHHALMFLWCSVMCQRG